MVKVNKAKSILVMATIMLTNCKTTQAQESLPAVLEYSSPEIRIALEQAIGSLMDSQPIKLADNVFTQNSTSLLIKNSQCYLQHNQSGHIKVMSFLNCKPL